MTCRPSGRAPSLFVISARRMASAPALSWLLIETSGSMIGISPCLTIWSAMSNCCLTTAAMPSCDARLMKEHLGAEHAALNRAFGQRLDVWHRLHQVDAVLFRRQALVHLDEGHPPPVLPQIGRNRLALRLAVHGALEQDGADDLLSVEGGRGDDAHPKFVHELEHLRLPAIGAVGNAVEAERPRGRSTPLVERSAAAIPAL